MKIGELVKTFTPKIFALCERDPDEFGRLKDPAFSRKAFGLYFPFCTPTREIPQKDSVRYWTAEHRVAGERVRVCSQWAAYQRDQFCRYLVSKGLASPHDLERFDEAPTSPSNEWSPNAARTAKEARGWMVPDPAVLDDLHEPLAAIGRVWASSKHRPRPTEASLADWDACLQRWVTSDLPLILRDSRRRGETSRSADGRMVIFGDNTPANWALGLALAEGIPKIDKWTPETTGQHVPLSFVNRSGFKRDLNVAGWKVCHIESVSDRVRYKVEETLEVDLRPKFIRFMSPRNMFLVPKVISGAGELPEMIQAIIEFERRNER